ncbi:MAG: ribonuclease, partial [Acidobacteriota bacterium]|nr:ribonuclease [Acidobacteriota bacterium]
MSKELFVSSTPHETKVAVVEDDALAEIYFERENEYTLAGSIYKGRVNRVLPGMQSAFVDVGLERDAFLYVSDFFEDQEEFDAIAGPAEDDGTRTSHHSPEPMTAAEPRRESSGSAAPAGEGPGGNPDQGSRRWRGRRRRG